MDVDLSLSAGLIVPAAIAVLFSAAVQSATGFGFSIVAVPFLAVLLGVRDGVIVNLVLTMIANLAVTARVHEHCSATIVRPMAFGSVFGLVPGMLLFYTVDVQLLKIVIAALVTFVALVLLTGVTFRFRQRRMGSVATGVVSGFLGGSVGLAGPPLTVYLAGLDLSKAQYRGTMSMYFTVLNVVLVPTHVIASGSFDVVAWSLLLLPAVALGAWFGRQVFARIAEQWFLRVVALIVLVAGLGGLGMSGT